ncbi:MAG: aminotransferase class V-fold PLP-dependent enzyme [Polyangiaceae bacterium]
MTRIYFDNAATTFPKPPRVIEAMQRYAIELGASPGRGSYRESRESGQLLQTCRERINQLIHGEAANAVIFTLNATDALNLAIQGWLRPGDHAITTWLDHNSVLRPYNALVDANVIEQTRVPCDPQTGLVDPDEVRRAIRKNTRLISVAHASNVTGTLQPLAAIARVAKDHGVALLVDAAQTLGHVPIDVQADGIDFLAAPGHKGLLGPLGTGVLYIRPELAAKLRPIRQGGTGSVSELDVQPDFLPDRFEPGSHNTIGLVGLSEGVKYILDQGIDGLWAHERALVRRMLEILERGLPGLRLFGPTRLDDRVGVFSIRVDGYDAPQLLSDVLESRFGLLTRSGLHCAPLAHRTVGSFELGGTTRFSFGPFNTLAQIDRVESALTELCRPRTALTGTA